MATTKERILISLTPDMSRELAKRAKRERSPKATIASRLLQSAIDEVGDEEDRFLSAAGARALKANKRWYTHGEVWGAKRGR